MKNGLMGGDSWKTSILLMVLALIVSVLISYFQPFPGYMDADYYFAGGVQLAEGKGFTEPYLWNYFDPSNDLPHPSHGYWMPLASILTAGGMFIAGSQTWLAGRIGFILIAMIIPVLTAELAYSFTKRKDLSLISGLLAIFSGYYAAYMQVTDTFGLYMLLGGIFFLIAHRDNQKGYFLMGILTGFLHLARADGIFWLIISLLIIGVNNLKNRSKPTRWIILSLICVFGYLLVMGPWFIRNYLVFGSLLGPQAANMIWLTNYDQIFSFPPNINFSHWINQGFVNIINPRISALLTNLTSTMAVQGNIILLPLIIFAGWRLRKDQRIGILLVGWIGIILLMSFVFPFAGRRGGFFHAGAALQPVFWSLAPIGMEAIIEKVGLKRSWNIKTAVRVFSMSLILFSVFFTGYITLNKIYQKDDHRFIWGIQEKRYESMGGMIESDSLERSTVIVGNPPGFFLATGNQAIAIPDGDEQNLLLVADEFNADYLILEPGGYPDSLSGLYDGSSLNKSFDLLNDLDGLRIYEINHDQ